MFWIFGCHVLKCPKVLGFCMDLYEMIYDLNDRLYLMQGLPFHKETYGLLSFQLLFVRGHNIIIPCI